MNFFLPNAFVYHRQKPSMTGLEAADNSRLVHRNKSGTEEPETRAETDGGLEHQLLHSVDMFLTSLDSKLHHLEKYLLAAQNAAEDPHKPSAGRQLFDAIKTALAQNHEYNLHPLSQVLDLYYSNEPLEGDTIYQRVLHGLQKLDEKISDVEQKYDIMPKHPQERLGELKGSLYNYDKALINCKERTLNFYELPFQWRENKYIIYGYKFAPSHAHAWHGVGCLHNESMNIWTHLLGACFVGYLSLYHFPQTDYYTHGTFIDHLVMYQFHLSAILCLLFSVIWHTYTNIAILDIRSKFACFDYTGITILIISSIITTEHLALYDHPIYKYGFISFSLLSGVVGVVLAWHPFFDKPESRPFRILFFIALSALGVTAFILASFIRGAGNAYDMYQPLLKSFAWYLSGVFFYGYLFPERLRSDVIVDEFEISDETIMDLDKKGHLETYLNKTPQLTGKVGFWALGWIDYIGNSHNFWHLFVMGGILGHYWGVLDMFKIGIINQQS